MSVKLTCLCLEVFNKNSVLLRLKYVTGSVNNLGTPCLLLPLPPFAMLKRLEHVLFSVRNASGLYNIERGKGYRPQRCQMSQELLTETVVRKQPLMYRFQILVETFIDVPCILAGVNDGIVVSHYCIVGI